MHHEKPTFLTWKMCNIVTRPISWLLILQEVDLYFHIKLFIYNLKIIFCNELNVSSVYYRYMSFMVWSNVKKSFSFFIKL